MKELIDEIEGIKKYKTEAILLLLFICLFVFGEYIIINNFDNIIIPEVKNNISRFIFFLTFNIANFILACAVSALLCAVVTTKIGLYVTLILILKVVMYLIFLKV
jgi:hypothetical protein